MYIICLHAQLFIGGRQSSDWAVKVLIGCPSGHIWLWQILVNINSYLKDVNEHYLQDYEENRASYVRIIIAIQRSDTHKGNYVEGIIYATLLTNQIAQIHTAK